MKPDSSRNCSQRRQAQAIWFDVECADRLATGILRLGVGDIEVILLDLSLPDSLGEETFTKMKVCAPDTAIVVLTGCDDEAVALKLVKAGPKTIYRGT